jgi:DNA-binding NarL/FixJ family response regulator
MLAFWDRDFSRSMAVYEEALEIWHARGDRHPVPFLLNMLGLANESAGHRERAGSCWARALALASEMGDQANMSRALTNLAGAAERQGDAAQGERLREESLTLARAAGNKQVLALALRGMARLSERRGATEQAAELYKECLAAYHDLGVMWGVTLALEGVASIAASWGYAQLAVHLWAAASNLRQALAMPIPAVVSGKSPGDDARAASVAAARAALGDEVFERAWATGFTMPLTDVVDEALAMTPPADSDAELSPPKTAPGHDLTARELDVLRQIVEGKSDREIAAELFISHHTVSRHVSNILGKLGVESRTAAATYAARHRLL